MAYEDNYAILHGGTKEKQADLCQACKDLIMDYISEIRTETEEKTATPPAVVEDKIDTLISRITEAGYIVYKKPAKRSRIK